MHKDGRSTGTLVTKVICDGKSESSVTRELKKKHTGHEIEIVDLQWI